MAGEVSFQCWKALQPLESKTLIQCPLESVEKLLSEGTGSGSAVVPTILLYSIDLDNMCLGSWTEPCLPHGSADHCQKVIYFWLHFPSSLVNMGEYLLDPRVSPFARAYSSLIEDISDSQLILAKVLEHARKFPQSLLLQWKQAPLSQPFLIFDIPESLC